MLIVISCLAGLTATSVCLRAWRATRATTLAAPFAWAAGSLTVVTATVGCRFAVGQSQLISHLDFLSGLTTIAPFVALLGAKRPQDRAWQLIVAALLVLLAFQDFRSWSLDPSMPPALHPAWRWLLTALVVMQAANYAPTRHVVAAFLACAGQFALLQPNLAFEWRVMDNAKPAGLLLLAAAVLAATAGEFYRPLDGDSYQQLWREFRDRYGALWALRVKERVNVLAEQHRSTMQLSWSGFRQADENTSAVARVGEDDPARKALKSILARFNRAETSIGGPICTE